MVVPGTPDSQRIAVGLRGYLADRTPTSGDPGGAISDEGSCNVDEDSPQDGIAERPDAGARQRSRV
jgi:hypothetical protein